VKLDALTHRNSRSWARPRGREFRRFASEPRSFHRHREPTGIHSHTFGTRSFRRRVQVFSGSENSLQGGEAIERDHTARETGDRQYRMATTRRVSHAPRLKRTRWEVDLKATSRSIASYWNRIGGVEDRLAGCYVELLNEARSRPRTDGKTVPSHRSRTKRAGPQRGIRRRICRLRTGWFPASAVPMTAKKKNGWAIGGATGSRHADARSRPR
jgi:hypothetical protein